MEWRSISDIEGYEEFTNFKLNIQGELRNNKTGYTLEWSVNRGGYLRASLSQAPFEKNIVKHRAIACLFIPNPLNLPTVDHIDHKDKLNNNIENLRWATYSQQNCNKGLLRNNTSGEPNIRPTLDNGKPVWEICIYIAKDQLEEQDKDKRKRKYKYIPRDPNSNVIPQEVIDKRDEMKLKYHGNPRNI
jgi:hypothetical protein